MLQNYLKITFKLIIIKKKTNAVTKAFSYF